ncbi:MAG: alpha-amylase, partial [Candidatus Marinimicrobia bacterium]|nr:alpha-amylase [Candidatus Neomarinimicrobiota bacterium]
PGLTELKIIASDSLGNVDSAAVTVMVNPAIELATRPAGTVDGINYNSVTSATLSLFAPDKKFVYLIGDFNNWQPEMAYFMKKDESDPYGDHFWLILDNLSPGTEYAFQYLVDGEIRIADPYADKILDPWNDGYISSDTYPNLITYPGGKTEWPVAVLQTAQSEYVWQHSDTFVKPEKSGLVIYEMLLRDFLAAHDFATLLDTLDYFERLGVSAIELMPFNEFEGNSSWGYNPSFYFAPDKYYGPKHLLKEFIDAAHERGIAVIMDMVLNHSYGLSPLVRLYWEGDGPAANNPWYNQTSPNPVYSWGYDFNHLSPHTQAFVDRVNKYWLTEYKVDGFRFDFTKGFTQTAGDGGAYDASRINILKRMADEIWETNSSAYVILEHFADNSEETILADYGMLLWGNTNHNYNEATMGYNASSKSDFSWGYYGRRGWSQPHLVTYMESHDEERLMYKNLQYGNVSGDYSTKDLPTALNRMKLAGAFFFTLPGPKMIWQFQELGYDYSIDYGGRLGEKPIRWDYLDDPNRLNLFKTYAALMHLRNANEVFRSG